MEEEHITALLFLSFAVAVTVTVLIESGAFFIEREVYFTDTLPIV